MENLEDVRVEEAPQQAPFMTYPPPMIRRTPFMVALVRPPRPNFVSKNNIRPSKVVRAVTGPTIARPGNVVVVSGQR